MKPFKYVAVLALVAAIVYLAPGIWRLKAIYMRPLIGTATLTGVLLSPETATLVPGQAIQFSAVGKFSDGGLEPTFVSFTATGGTVAAGGLYTASSSTGTYRVIAQASGSTLSDTSTVTITPLSTAPDAVKLMNQLPPTASATVLIDGPRSGSCDTDNVFLGSGTINVGSLLAPSTLCPAEVAVFSSGNAMRLDTPVNSWTNNGGDVRNETLAAPIRVPVVIWLITARIGIDPLAELVNANALFSDQKIGIDFDTSPGVEHDYSSDPSARAVVGDRCDYAPGVRNSAYYQEHALNFYYVSAINHPDDPIGWNCVDAGAPNQIYVSMSSRTITTLAHEIGHALGLQIPFDGHINTLDADGNVIAMRGFGPDSALNLMWSWGVGRDVLTLGQAYRMSVERNSWVNLAPSLRSGQPVKDCGCNPFHQDSCPRLARNLPGAVTTGFTGTTNPVFPCSMVLCRVTGTGTPPPDCSSGGVNTIMPGATISLAINGDMFLRASVLDTMSVNQPSLYPIWSGTDPTIASVRFDGKVHGLLKGCVVVNAWAGGARGRVKVDVGGSGAC